MVTKSAVLANRTMPRLSMLLYRVRVSSKVRGDNSEMPIDINPYLYSSVVRPPLTNWLYEWLSDDWQHSAYAGIARDSAPPHRSNFGWIFSYFPRKRPMSEIRRRYRRHPLWPSLLSGFSTIISHLSRCSVPPESRKGGVSHYAYTSQYKCFLKTGSLFIWI